MGACRGLRIGLTEFLAKHGSDLLKDSKLKLDVKYIKGLLFGLNLAFSDG